MMVTIRWRKKRRKRIIRWRKKEQEWGEKQQQKTTIKRTIKNIQSATKIRTKLSETCITQRDLYHSDRGLDQPDTRAPPLWVGLSMKPIPPWSRDVRPVPPLCETFTTLPTTIIIHRPRNSWMDIQPTNTPCCWPHWTWARFFQLPSVFARTSIQWEACEHIYIHTHNNAE